MSNRRRRAVNDDDDSESGSSSEDLDEEDECTESESESEHETESRDDAQSGAEDTKNNNTVESPPLDSKSENKGISSTKSTTHGRRNKLNKDPAFVARSDRFFLHDDREETNSSATKGPSAKNLNDNIGKRASKRQNNKPPLDDDDFMWKHDRYEALIEEDDNDRRPKPSRRGQRPTSSNKEKQLRSGHRSRGKRSNHSGSKYDDSTETVRKSAGTAHKITNVDESTTNASKEDTISVKANSEAASNQYSARDAVNRRVNAIAIAAKPIVKGPSRKEQQPSAHPTATRKKVQRRTVSGPPAVADTMVKNCETTTATMTASIPSASASSAAPIASVNTSNRNTKRGAQLSLKSEYQNKSSISSSSKKDTDNNDTTTGLEKSATKTTNKVSRRAKQHQQSLPQNQGQSSIDPSTVADTRKPAHTLLTTTSTATQNQRRRSSPNSATDQTVSVDVNGALKPPGLETAVLNPTARAFEPISSPLTSPSGQVTTVGGSSRKSRKNRDDGVKQTGQVARTTSPAVVLPDNTALSAGGVTPPVSHGGDEHHSSIVNTVSASGMTEEYGSNGGGDGGGSSTILNSNANNANPAMYIPHGYNGAGGNIAGAATPAAYGAIYDPHSMGGHGMYHSMTPVVDGSIVTSHMVHDQYADTGYMMGHGASGNMGMDMGDGTVWYTTDPNNMAGVTGVGAVGGVQGVHGMVPPHMDPGHIAAQPPHGGRRGHSKGGTVFYPPIPPTSST